MTKTSNNSNTTTGNNSNLARKPRRSIKAEGNCLNGMLREGLAKVIDASKLGKRLSSEIWNSFGAIQVEDSFTYPSIDTKIVADGSSTLKICQFFVACSKCFSVFKYDGHAYGTTGLVKHVKICQGTHQRGQQSSLSGYTSNATIEHTLDTTHTTTSSSVPNNNSNNITTATTTTVINGPVNRRTKREPSTTKARAYQQPSLKYLAKVIEELRCEQADLKQKIHEMINVVQSSYIGHVQIISNDGDKVEDGLQKTD